MQQIFRFASRAVVTREPFYKLRPIKTEEIKKLIEMKRIQGSHDVYSGLCTWHRMDPEGIIVAVSDKNELMAVIAALRFTEDLYFGSMFYVAKEYRKLRIGKEIYDYAVNCAGEMNAGSNAVPGILGFFSPDFTIMEDRFVLNINETTSDVNHKTLSSHVPAGVEIQTFQDCHLPYMYAYDTELMGYHRTFLEWSCKEKDAITFVAIKNVAGTRECVGFGSIKESCLGAGRVGPLYADDPRVAEALLKRLITSMPHVRGFVMMSLSSNQFASGLIRKICCPTTKKYDRLYKREIVDVDDSKVYAVFDMNSTFF